MALSNAQYESIIHKYDVTRLNNRHELEKRREFVYNNVEGYRELDESMVTVSLDCGKKKLSGDESAIEELHALLTDLKEMKASLLKGAGLSVDYLDEIYDCKDCKDTGYIGFEKCHCFKKQEIEFLYDQSNIREFLSENNFSTLSYNYYEGESLERFKKAEMACHVMVDSFGDKEFNIILYGTVGIGKSFLSGCVAQELIEKGYSCLYYSSSSLFDHLADEAFGRKNQSELYNFNDYIYNCDLLIVDDLGTELTNSFVSSQLFTLISERSLRQKSTIISTNLSLEEIRDRYSDRVFSRIVSGYSCYKLTGPDIRTIKKQLSVGK